MYRLRLAVFSAALLSACGTDLPHDAPFDPNSALDKQARAAVTAQVTLEGESDASQVTLELQNAERTYTGTTRSDGSVTLTGVVPGVYDARLTTRYYADFNERITVTLGETFDLGLRRLSLARAAVTGKASYDRGGAAGPVGGILVSLVRMAGIRKASFTTSAASDDTGMTYSTFSGGDGDYRIDGVPAGEYSIEAQNDDGTPFPIGDLTITGDEPEVTADPVVFKVVSGFFEVEGVSNGAPSQVYSQVTDVTLKLSGFNAVKMRLGEAPTPSPAGCTFTGGDLTFVALKTYALPHEGDNHVCVVFVGEDGAETEPLVESIFLDSVPPVAGSLFLNDGLAFTTSQLVTATFSASGADQMYVSYTGCNTGGAWQDYAPVAYLNLGSGGGTKTVYVTYRDWAGNRSSCVSDTIVLDTALNAPSWNAAFTGGCVLGARTSCQLGTLTLSGLTSDVTEMRVANDASFAGSAWSAVQSPVTWLLTPGDGLKTVYVKLRDAAGNESTARPVSITLDQTGPDVPGFAVQDIDGDGYALSATTIELKWNTPSAGDLAGFEIERYVQGVNPSFAHLVTLVANQTTYRDGVTATSGKPHYYQLRAFDDLGNVSAWSVAAHTIPFQGPDSITWINTEDGLRYFFPVAAGTNSLTPSYFYSDLAGADYVSGLASNVTEWLRPAASNAYWDETVVMRTANQDNSLIYQASVPLRLSGRETVDHDPGGSYLGYGQGIATDKQGNAYLSYFDGQWGYLYVATNKSGTWVRETADPTYVVSTASQVLLDSKNKIHVVYMTGSGLNYANNVTGTWNHRQVLSGNVRKMSAAMGSDDKIHIVYNITTACCTTSDIKYATITNDVWATSLIQTVGYNQEAPSIAVALDGTAHVAYHNATGADLIYAVKPAAGGWTISTLDAPGTVGLAPSIALDSAGLPQISYRNSTYDVRWIKKTAGGWAAYQTVATAAVNYQAETGITVTPEGETFIFYPDSSNKFWMLRNNGVTWTKSQIDQNIDNGTYGQTFRVTRDRRRIQLVCMEIYERNVRYISVYPGGLLKDMPDANYYSNVASADMAVGSDGSPAYMFFSYGDWNLNGAIYKNNAWTTSVIEYQGMNPRMTVDSSGQFKGVYTAYSGGNYVPKFTSYSGSSWTTETIDASATTGGKIDLALQAGGLVSAAYVDNALAKAVRYATRAQGGGWTFQTVATSWQGFPASVAIKPNGDPVVLYTGTDKRLTVVERINGTWTPLGFAAPVTTTGYDQSVTVASDGSIHVAYQETTGADMMYATNRDGAWSYTNVDSLGDSGYRPHLMADKYGTVHLFFLGGSNRIMYATDAGGWHANVVVSLFYNGNFGSGAIDPSGNLYMLHTLGNQWYYRPLIGGRMTASSNGRIPAW